MPWNVALLAPLNVYFAFIDQVLLALQLDARVCVCVYVCVCVCVHARITRVFFLKGARSRQTCFFFDDVPPDEI
jgi:hypothetical protein